MIAFRRRQPAGGRDYRSQLERGHGNFQVTPHEVERERLSTLIDDVAHDWNLLDIASRTGRVRTPELLLFVECEYDVLSTYYNDLWERKRRLNDPGGQPRV